MSLFKEIRAITSTNVKSIPQRLGSSWVVVVGIAGVVGVLVAVTGMRESLSDTLTGTGRPDRAIVLRAGANSEGASTLTTDARNTIADAPGIARTSEGKPAVTADVVAAVDAPRKSDGSRAGLTVRGVSPAAFEVRPEIRLLEGRLFTPGLREAIVGRDAQAEFRGLELGDTVKLPDGPWTIVGVFESGDAHESGLLADSDTLLSAYQRTQVSAVTVLLESPDAFESFKAYLTTNPTLSVDVQREDAYYRQQSQSAVGILRLVTTFVAGIMALGALFAALNTMYSAVSARTVEIATLRAIGFGAGGVVTSVLVEAVLLAVLGGALGAATAWLFFAGNTLSLGGGASATVFELRVTPRLLVDGIVWAATVGLLGGLLPAIRAARLPIATVLRAV